MGAPFAGRTVYRAAKKLGLQHVPVHVAADLTPEQAQAYRLADNKTAELAEWDDAKLTQEILGLAGQGLDLAEFGFPAPEAADADAGPDAPSAGGGDADKPGADIQILRCTFTARQQETVKKALEKAAKAGPFGPTGNGNIAGNALARMCEAYASQREVCRED